MCQGDGISDPLGKIVPSDSKIYSKWIWLIDFVKYKSVEVPMDRRPWGDWTSLYSNKSFNRKFRVEICWSLDNLQKEPNNYNSH